LRNAERSNNKSQAEWGDAAMFRSQAAMTNQQQFIVAKVRIKKTLRDLTKQFARLNEFLMEHKGEKFPIDAGFIFEVEDTKRILDAVYERMHFDDEEEARPALPVPEEDAA
jgi:hypothetical protein